MRTVKIELDGTNPEKTAKQLAPFVMEYCLVKTGDGRMGFDVAKLEHFLTGLLTQMRPTPNFLSDIIEFHEKFDLKYEGPPRLLPDAHTNETLNSLGDRRDPRPPSMAEFRRMFLKEEAKEYATATYRGNNALHLTMDSEAKAHEITEQLAHALDAIVDTIYVAVGNAYLHGFIPFLAEAWKRVHTANMAKVRASEASDSKRGTAFDVVKPPGWTAPDHRDLVAHHVHQPHVVGEFPEGDG